MMPVKEKLNKLVHMVHTYERALTGATCKNHDLSSPNCVLVNNVELEVAEYVQVAERQSLAHFKIFLRRCIDVIEFLTYIERELEECARRPFSDYVKELGPELQDRLSKHKYHDFIVFGASNDDLIHKLLEVSISMQTSEDARLSE